MDESPKDCENCRHYNAPLKFSPCPMCNWQAAPPSGWEPKDEEDADDG
jgi:hypothetical protein